jgi:hypothetical protein
MDIYGRASGANVNTHKSKALPLAAWTPVDTQLSIEMCSDMKILGVTFGRTIKQTIKLSWREAIQMVKVRAGLSYHRHLSLAHRIQFVTIYLFAKLWFLAQVLPPPSALVKRLEIVAAWFIWHGVIFKVPLDTLQRPKEEGRWGLDNR